MVKRTPKAKVKKKPLPRIECKGCGVMFVPATRKQKYHEEKCRIDYYNRTYFRNDPTMTVCPNCGNSFLNTKPGTQDYCQPSCRIEAAEKRRNNAFASTAENRQAFFTRRYKQMSADGFACRLCGKMARDGITLDVVDNPEGGDMTVCNMCQAGMKTK